MTYDELMEWVDARPFEPFRVRMSSGHSHEVHHSSMIWPGMWTVLIGLPGDPNRPDVPGKHVTLSMGHIAKIQPLEPAATS